MTQATEIQDIYPLSYMQEGMLFHSLLDSGSNAYVEQISFTVSGDLCIDTFQKSLDMLVSRYDIFRTIFIKEVPDLEGPQQVVLSRRDTAVRTEDISDYSEERQQSIIDKFKETDRHKGFDLQKGPLMRLTLFQTGENRHTCVWTHHHIMMDGWSLGLVLKDFFSMYYAIRSGRPVNLGSPAPYSTYIKWLRSRNKEETSAFWSRCLEDYGETVSVPQTKNKTAQNGYASEHFQFSLEPETVQKLTDIARGIGVTLNTIFTGIWGLLLHRYNGTEDAVFGSVVSGRPSAISGIESMAGLFINTVPVRVRAAGDMTFSSLLKKVQKESLAAEEHSYYPLYDIQNESGLQKDLLNHILVFENYPVQMQAAVNGWQQTESSALSLENFSMAEETNYDLNVVIVPGEEFYVKFSYNAGIYDREDMKRIKGHILEVISCVTEDPDRLLSSISLVPPEEEALIHSFNETNRPYPETTVHGLFEEQAAKTPDQEALRYNGVSWSYKKLNQRANQIAHALREKGARSDQITAVMLRRSMSTVAALLGIWKSGSAYMPIDAEFPPERISFLLRDSEASLLLTEKDLLPLIPPHFKGSVVIMEETVSQQTAPLPPVSDSGNWAYVIYTSGTTGRPKGVLVQHKAISNTLQWRREEYGMTEGDIALHLFSYVFDGSLTSLFTPLLSGACVLLTDEDDAKDVLSIKQKIARHGVSHLLIVPSLYRVLLDSLTKKDAQTLRAVTFAGEAATPDIVEASRNICPNAELLNEYGPTENSVATTILRNLQKSSRITIGRPIANTSVYMMHGDRLQPVGAVGELCISGKGLADGYFQQKELTDKVFTPHPFRKGERLYRTGDAARFLPDGTIEYMGRFDDQVKVRGYRIELGEIETALRSLSGVKEAAVIVRKTADGEQELAAYAVLENAGVIFDPHAELAGRLPAYMIPGSFTKLTEMPLSVSGKLDRAALPEPKEAERTGDYQAPRTMLETELLSIWQEVLKREHISMRDDFFQIGGQSLKAASLVSKIHKRLEIELAVRHVFEHPTIESMARFLEQRKRGEYAEITPAEAKDLYPLSFAQKRLYALHQLAADSTGYHMPACLELSGRLNRDRLHEAFSALLQRHEALRTSFVLRNGEPMQHVHSHVDLDLTEIHMPSGTLLQEAMETFVKPFDVEKAPLLRVTLAKATEERHFLLLDMHHLIADGVSMSVLIQELTDLYRGKELRPLKLQYKDFSVWQHERFAAEEFKRHERYWLDAIGENIPVLDLPLDKKRPQLPDFSGSVVRTRLQKETAENLRRLMDETSSTLYMILLAGYSLFLSKLSGQEDIVVGSPAAGRSRAELDGVIGMFVNTVAMRSRPKGDKTFRAYLEEVKMLALGAAEHQDFPFEELAQKLDTHREVNRNPLFDAMLVLQNSDDFKVNLPGLSVSSHAVKHDISKFDLTLHAEEQPDGSLDFHFEYSTALFEKGTIERWAGHFKELLGQIAADDERKLSDIHLLDTNERQMLLQAENQTAEYPRHETIVSLFEAQAEKMPDQIAAVMSDERLTYRELNEKADQIADMLSENGIRSGQIVGIMTERSPEMLIGIFGILKAGGAYLPIDPDYPDERISFMLTDSGARVLLTQSGLGISGMDGLPVLYIDKPESVSADRTKEMITPEQPAYVIYTSGTTGKPKGVMTEHRNVISLITHKGLPFDFGTGDVWTLFHSYCFDFSVWEIFGALLYGGKVVIVPKETARDPHLYRQLLQSEGVTVLNQTPTAFSGLIHEEAGHADKLKLRYVIFGGEALQPGMLKSWKEKYPETELVNMYGITETTVHVTCKKLNMDDIERNKSNIGRPLETLHAFVMDAYMNPQPIGIPGELYIGGEGVARGYVNRNDLTASRFITNPHITGMRLYRTGDIAKRLSNGELEYVGRKDAQVKVRGHRIELGEIKSALQELSFVKEAAVITRADQHGQHSIYAYAVLHGNEKIKEAEVQASLRAFLPEYMIPARLIELDELPLTANGKLDEKALPQPELNESLGDDISLRNETEEMMADIWEELLGVEGLGPNAHFFHLGGDSIKALQVCARLKQQGYETTVRELFEHQTLGEVSMRLRKVRRVIDQAPVTGDVPLTPIQHWFFSQSLPHDHFNQSVMLSSADRINESAMRKALAQLAVHHDALRMVCGTQNGSVIQYNRADNLSEEELFTFETHDVRGKGSLQEEHAAIEQAAARIQTSIRLETGPLVAVGLFHANDGDHLLLSIHHLVIDGVSWRILFEDLTACYRQALEGKEAALPAKTDSYQTYAKQISDYAKSRRLLQEADYWSEREKAAVKPLPKDARISSNLLKDTDVMTVTLTKQETEQLLTEANRAYTTETGELLLAALSLALNRWTGNETFKISMEGHGREEHLEHLDISRTIGWFTSIYPVLVDASFQDQPDDGERLGYHIKRTKDMMRRIPHKGAGYGVLKYISKLWGETESDSPEISFNYLGQFDREIRSSGFGVSPVKAGNEVSPDWERPYTLDISGSVSSECLSMHVVYNRFQYQKETIEVLTGYFHTFLKQIITHCTGKEEREWSAADFSDEELTLEDLSDIMGAVNKL
ncbi:amino acid adenylation domain-containing protein [Bacillus velezensis]|uniref:non-ribosomal peptide synthetase n=1 Tax=Bacillus velezensis TaxID=492670 RepID=UPI0018C75D13|nr:non-ribosomal peptide synthetase [Bacillus velezensis]QPK87040.1 amino acid adenylation domain-containing protein [Bacillus velezensis]